MENNGYLIVFDGIDGCGKSTQIQIIGDRLKALGLPIYRTSEPSGNEYGQLMRKRLKEPHDKILDPHIDALLFTLDRYDHCMREIIPQLNQGNIVLTDRYYYSTIAYQSAQGVDKKWLTNLQQYLIKPNIYFLFDIEPTIALMRITNREVKERFEKEAFLIKVRKNFLSTASKLTTEKVYIINALESIGNNAGQIMDILTPFVEGFHKSRSYKP
jgi:dTMP kinase